VANDKNPIRVRPIALNLYGLVFLQIGIIGMNLRLNRCAGWNSGITSGLIVGFCWLSLGRLNNDVFLRYGLINRVVERRLNYSVIIAESVLPALVAKIAFKSIFKFSEIRIAELAGFTLRNDDALLSTFILQFSFLLCCGKFDFPSGSSKLPENDG
jgi:hypothetical protein